MVKVTLKFVRIRQNISLKRLSLLSGISKSEICNIENGTVMPKIDTLYYLSKALNVRLEELYTYD